MERMEQLRQTAKHGYVSRSDLIRIFELDASSEAPSNCGIRGGYSAVIESWQLRPSSFVLSAWEHHALTQPVVIIPDNSGQSIGQGRPTSKAIRTPDRFDTLRVSDARGHLIDDLQLDYRTYHPSYLEQPKNEANHHN